MSYQQGGRMHRYWKKIVVTAFLVSWLILAWYSVQITRAFSTYRAFNPYRDVSRRVTSPNGQHTAVLVRDLGYPDLNFKLYIGGPSRAGRIYVADPHLLEESTLVWVSRDYEPTTLVNWHEDIFWTADSTVVAVSILGQFVVAYDIASNRTVEDPREIERLLNTRGGLQPTATPYP